MARIIEARVIQKVDTEQNWNTNELILYKGEIALVGDPDRVYNIKVGNGFKKFRDLPYMVDYMSGLYTSEITPQSQVPSGVNNTFLVSKQGTYTNFGGVVLPKDNLGIIYKNGSNFTIQLIPIVSEEKLQKYIDEKLVDINVGFGGEITSLAQSPNVQGMYIPKVSGVYPNFGNLEYNPIEGFTIFLYKDGQFSKIVVPLNAVEGYVEFNNNALGVSGSAVEKYAVKKVNTISELRNTQGEYNGQIISLLGYYEKGDKDVLNYKFQSTKLTDDGGSVINSLNGSWVAIFKKQINVLHFGLKNDMSINNSPFLQKLIDFIPKNNFNNTPFNSYFGDTIYFPSGNYRFDDTLSFNRPSFTINGDGNRSTVLFSNTNLLFDFHPKLNGTSPFTNSGFGGVFFNNIGIISNSTEVNNNGVGIQLTNCFVGNFTNLYISGFKKNINLRGCHFIQLNNFYCADEKTTGSNPNEEIFNRGYAVYVDKETHNFETHSTSLKINGGWLHNTSLELENLNYGIIEGIDIEPASQTVIVGYGNVFKNNRFERMDYYAIYSNPVRYERFPWFTVKGDYNKFENNFIHALGYNNANGVNPIFLVEGDYNEIEVKEKTIHNGICDFKAGTKGNTLILDGFFDAERLGVTDNLMESNSGMWLGENNIILKESISEAKILGSKSFELKNLLNINNLINNLSFIQGLTKTGDKFTVLNESSKRIILNFNTTTKYTKGTYALKFKVKTSIKKKLHIRLSYLNSSECTIDLSDCEEGRYFICRFKILNENDFIMPTFVFYNFIENEFIHLSEVELLKFNSGKYIENFLNLNTD